MVSLSSPKTRKVFVLAGGFVLALLAAPSVQAACSVGTTLAVGACPQLAPPGCCSTASKVQWCEGGNWCELDCSEAAPVEGPACTMNPLNSCCERCGTYDEAAGCQCDEGCEGHGDCCPDFGTLCEDSDASFCAWVVSATFTGYGCAAFPAPEPTGTYPYTCESDQAVECSCAGKSCGDDGCGGSCGDCPAGSFCDPVGQCVCAGSCIGKTCGEDGCGNSCGECPLGEFCVDGLCEGACTPDCSGKDCGGDGCGGECGECPVGQQCSWTGVCEEGCTPNCVGKLCGDDGCGGLCGECAQGESCNENGQCEITCESNCLGKQCGDDGCGGSCGSCPQGSCQENLCVAGCSGDCVGKSCGPDGCGGSCGGCAAGEECSALGTCEPGCQPQCDGRDCGDDGCGGDCGTCSPSAFCSQQGSCTESSEADASTSTPSETCPPGSYWNPLVGECAADDGTNLAVNRGGDSESGCQGGGGTSPLGSALVLAFLAWSRARRRSAWPAS